MTINVFEMGGGPKEPFTAVTGTQEIFNMSGDDDPFSVDLNGSIIPFNNSEPHRSRAMVNNSTISSQQHAEESNPFDVF